MEEGTVSEQFHENLPIIVYMYIIYMYDVLPVTFMRCQLYYSKSESHTCHPQNLRNTTVSAKYMTG